MTNSDKADFWSGIIGICVWSLVFAVFLVMLLGLTKFGWMMILWLQGDPYN